MYDVFYPKKHLLSVSGFNESSFFPMPDSFVKNFLLKAFGIKTLESANICNVIKYDNFFLFVPNRRMADAFVRLGLIDANSK